jgi:hypothetical protein
VSPIMPTRLRPTAKKVSGERFVMLPRSLLLLPNASLSLSSPVRLVYDRQRTARCPDGGRARELTRNSQPSGAGLEAGALGTLRSRRFFAAGTSRSPFRAIPVEGSPPDPVAIDISSPKMMMENRAAQQAPKIRIVMAYFPRTLIN